MTDPKDDAARRYQAYLEEWLARDARQRELRPLVSRLLSTATWQVTALDTIYRNSPEMAGELNGEIDRNLQLFTTTFPLPVEYTDAVVSASSSVAVTSNAAVFQTLVSLRGDGVVPPEPRWSDIQVQIDDYQKLVDEQERADEAGRRVARLYPNLSERFVVAKNSANAARGDQTAEEAAAFAMRTFLDKLKGELFDEATKAGVKNVTWELMAERLAPRPEQRSILGEQDHVRRGLIESLSSIGKARGSPYKFNEVWTRFVDHVYVVCGLVLAGKAPAA